MITARLLARRVALAGGAEGVFSFGPLPVGAFVRGLYLYLASDMANDTIGCQVLVSSKPVTAAADADARDLTVAVGANPPLLVGPATDGIHQYFLPVNGRVIDVESHIAVRLTPAAAALSGSVWLDAELPVASVESSAPIGLGR